MNSHNRHGLFPPRRPMRLVLFVWLKCRCLLLPCSPGWLRLPFLVSLLALSLVLAQPGDALSEANVAKGVAQTVTPDLTATAMPTSTATSTYTYTPTPTLTLTPTRTPTGCRWNPCTSPTSTRTRTPTATSTPTSTATLSPTSISTATATATATPACQGTWRIIESPNPSTVYNQLPAVAVISPVDVWAVGFFAMSYESRNMTLTMHWDGTQWTRVPSPNHGTDHSYLVEVTAISTNDVWAVGWYHDVNRGWYTLTEHWNGTQWSIVPSPNQNSVENYLMGVSAVSTNDVWAVGYYVNNSGIYKTLVQHWNGSQWSIVPSPNVGIYNNRLNAVSALSANDVWAVGNAGGQPLTLVQRWNGSQWSVVPSPNPPGSNNNFLWGVEAISPNDVWAVGSYQGQEVASHTLVERWDGSAWNIVPSPDLGQGFNSLQAIAAISPTDIWAVGYLSGSYQATVTEHWDGQQWSIVPSPNRGSNENRLFGVDATSSGDVWAVGIWNNCLGCPDYTLIEHYTAQCPSPTPSLTPSPSSSPTNTLSPTPSSTTSPGSTPSMTSTAMTTATAATTTPTLRPSTTAIATGTATSITTSTAMVTGTPTFTPATCTLTFSDVPPGSTFYPYIRCLACIGIISGYDDGTFRPGNNVTRGPLSKIISNSAGFNDMPIGQTFEDVPSGSTFYLYIERMASRGIIGGYPCGGPGEPCVSPGGRPYFRPNANATRGQIAKIDVLAAVQSLGWTLLDPPTNTFQDVLPGSTFFQYIETAASHGVLGGYQCGSPPAGECIRPGNKPYFLQNNNATRGQTSKIVANTFLPNCQTLNR